jgi:hypothetical protein
LFESIALRSLMKTSLAATMIRWFEGGVNRGLLPMTIREEVIHSVHAIY